jgi:hypothetical protein
MSPTSAPLARSWHLQLGVSVEVAENPRIRARHTGAAGPVTAMLPGAKRPALAPAALCAAALLGCGDDVEERTLEQTIVVGMTSNMAATYDDDEITFYEVKAPIDPTLPIERPTQAELETLRQYPTPPYGRRPWLFHDELELQLTWTLSNLDPDDRAVRILIDPWNEFGRYWPGFTVTDAQQGEQLPNLSGIDLYLIVPGTASGRESRVRGVFTWADMDELAIDLATVINVIETVQPAEGEEYDPRASYVNHAFDVRNRSDDDPLIAPYIPAAIPALTGFDVGLRTFEPANVAIEVSIELRDHGSGRIVPEGGGDELIGIPRRWITVDAAAGGM